MRLQRTPFKWVCASLQQKMEMTTPVLTTAGQTSKSGKMAFVMEERMGIDSLPMPTDSRCAISMALCSSGRLSVITYVLINCRLMGLGTLWLSTSCMHKFWPRHQLNFAFCRMQLMTEGNKVVAALSFSGLPLDNEVNLFLRYRWNWWHLPVKKRTWPLKTAAHRCVPT